jgi:protein TonB
MTKMRDVYSGDSPGLIWFVLALFLHGALFFSTRFWSQSETRPRVEETIQVSLIEMEAPPSEEPPAPLPPALPRPQPPRPRPPKPVVAPRPIPRLAPALPAPEPPMPLPEAPPEMPAVPAPPAPAPAPESAPNAASTSDDSSTADAASSGASASDSSSTANAAPSGASLVEARFDAAYLHNPKPPYPAHSKRLREEGTVYLRVHVLSNGKTDQVDIRRGSGFARLDESARMTVLRWRFVPKQRGNETVASWVIVPIRFNLETP